jgi:glycosyltransferase involved in cell wall biosynthesis
MKIGVVIDRMNVGGVEKIALEQVIALRKAGVNAELVVLREQGVVDDAFMDLKKGVPVIYLDKRLPSFFRLSFSLPMFHFFSLFHITYPFLLPFVLAKNEYSYLISHGTYTTLSTIFIGKVKRIPFSSFIWDPSSYIVDRVYSQKMNGYLYKFLRVMTISLDRFIINSSDKILVGGEAHNSFIRQINSSKEIKVIYPSVHPVAKQAKKKPYILMATAWKKGKNPEYIIELAPHIPDDVPIKMAGMWLDPDYRSEFEALLADSGLSGRVEVVGPVSEEELSKLYAEALFVLQTNDDRGFGMPALEASGKGTTFIIPRDQGVCKLFTDEVHGYYTKERDTKNISRLALYLIENPKVAEKMGRDAWSHVVNNYSWEKHAKQLISLID